MHFGGIPGPGPTRERALQISRNERGRSRSPGYTLREVVGTAIITVGSVVALLVVLLPATPGCTQLSQPRRLAGERRGLSESQEKQEDQTVDYTNASGLAEPSSE